MILQLHPFLHWQKSLCSQSSTKGLSEISGIGVLYAFKVPSIGINHDAGKGFNLRLSLTRACFQLEAEL
jgi:hypothetical protein